MFLPHMIMGSIMFYFCLSSTISKNLHCSFLYFPPYQISAPHKEVQLILYITNNTSKVSLPIKITLSVRNLKYHLSQTLAAHSSQSAYNSLSTMGLDFIQPTGLQLRHIYLLNHSCSVSSLPRAFLLLDHV